MNTANVELQLNFLAKELELERNRRAKLQDQVERMQGLLKEVDEDGRREVRYNLAAQKERILGMKPFDPDMEDIKVQNRGFVSI